MTTVVYNCSRVVTRQWNGKLFCNALAVALENVASSQQLEFYLLFLQNCLLVVQQGCKYVILAPLHYSNISLRSAGWDIRLQKCCDLENRVRGPSRSLDMSPFDRAHNQLWIYLVSFLRYSM